MGILDIFKGQREIVKEEIQEIPWKPLTKTETLLAIEEESQAHPVAIFKHSTRCGISKMVLKNLERGYNQDKVKAKMYFLDLLAHRDISNEVAARFGVIHESPQLIVFRHGKVVHHASHQAIEVENLEKTWD